ncbi:MAG: pilin [bacterium]|nr:pilin [bacterium]
MKKFLKIFLQFMVVMALMSIALNYSAMAKESLPMSEDGRGIIFKATIPVPNKDMAGQEITKTVVMKGLEYVKTITVVIAILYITILGYRLVTEGENEEEVTKAKRGLIFTAIALMMLSMSKELAMIFDMDKGKTLLGTPQEILKRVRLFDKQVEISITFIKFVIGTFATIMLVRSGVKLITAGGKEEETTKHKKSMLYSGGGLLLIYVGDVFINKVLYKVNKNVYTGTNGVHPKVDPEAGIAEIVGVTNFIVSFVGPIAVLMLVVGAIMYATAGGQEEQMEKAKKLMLATFLGIILIYGSFALVSTVVAGKLKAFDAIAE